MKGPGIVVSLTSFPGAIDYASGAVESILKGKLLPDKLVLYVTLSQFGDRQLPKRLHELEKENDIFEIRDYQDDIKSYRKLIPAIKDFPDSIVVTIDDDVAYHPEMLRSLMKWHARYPDHIIAQRAKRILLHKPYRKWKKYRWYNFIFNRVHDQGFLNLPTGVGGVLYPPGALKSEMLDTNLFTSLAPTADDIWFWAAATANSTKILPVPFGYNKPKGLGKPKELSLKTLNFKGGTDRNLEYFEAILEKYPEIRQRVENE